MNRKFSRFASSFHKLTNVFVFCFFAISVLIFSPTSLKADDLETAFTDGEILFDGRLRYENVDAAIFANDADGLTFRARFGYKTAPFYGFVLLAEGDFTRDLGVDDFNSTVNGKVGFPVIADPDSARLNRLSLAYQGLEKTTVEVGRQRIILDNSRFVGNVGFRQNEQTFDSARLKTGVVDGVTFTYIYLWQINRIFGSKSPVGQLDTNSHLFNVSYDKLPIGKITGYAYFMNIDGAAALSNQTYGVRLTGNQDIGKGFRALYTLGVAHQKEYKNSPANFGLEFIELEGGLSFQGAVALIGFEKLEGNGNQAFRTPLATLHKFQGFADQFLATPANGIEDLYFVLGYKATDVSTLGTVNMRMWYHDFSPDVAGPDLGEEFDFLFAVTPKIQGQPVTFSFKMANFYGSPILPDVRKFWFTIGLSF